MRKLVIQNSGLIKPEHLTLIGASTKRNDESSIGQFGSGNKYGIAACLREYVDIQIYSGKEQIDLDYDFVPFDMDDGTQQLLRRLTVNGEPTSITHEMGALDWTMWMALREFISNAIDAGGFNMQTIWGEMPLGLLQDDITTLVLEYNESIDEIMRNYGNYFAFERKATGMTTNGDLYYRKSNESYPIIYRKGIRCYNKLEINSRFDFNFNNIRINESRLADASDVKRYIRNTVGEMDANDMLTFLLEGHSTHYYPQDLSTTMIENFREIVATNKAIIAPKFLESIGPLMGIPSNALFISNKWYDTLIRLNIVKAADDVDPELEFVKKDGFDVDAVEQLLNKVNLQHLIVVSAAFDHWGSIKRIPGHKVLVKYNCTDTPLKIACEIIQGSNLSTIEKIFE